MRPAERRESRLCQGVGNRDVTHSTDRDRRQTNTLRMTWRSTRGCVSLLLFLLAGSVRLRADVSLLVEEPFGHFGEMNPTGHAAIYLDHVCAASLTRLRPCGPGEMGAVISRYHRVGGYDWLAVPVMPYLYAVEQPAEVPAFATLATEAKLRDQYRRRSLEAVAPDLPDGSTPGGEWIQLIGASYDRTIYGFTIETTREQDAHVMAVFNDRRNVSHFNLLFNNCADLSRALLDLYYPHAVRRSFFADFGFTTPKHLAEMLSTYGRRHPEAGLTTFLIPQVKGSIERSTRIEGVAESLVRSKKYLVPLAVFHPEFTGGLALAYLARGRYTMPEDAIPLSPENFVLPAPEIDAAATMTLLPPEASAALSVASAATMTGADVMVVMEGASEAEHGSGLLSTAAGEKRE